VSQKRTDAPERKTGRYVQALAPLCPELRTPHNTRQSEGKGFPQRGWRPEGNTLKDQRLPNILLWLFKSFETRGRNGNKTADSGCARAGMNPRQGAKYRELFLSSASKMMYGIGIEEIMTRTLLQDEPFIKDCFTCRLEPVWHCWEKGYRGVCRHLRGDRKYIYSMAVRPMRSLPVNAPAPRPCPLWQA